MTEILYIPAASVAKLMQDLSGTWGLSAWAYGEKVALHPTTSEYLKEKGFVRVHLTRSQTKRLQSLVRTESLEKRYEISQ
ncbi:hypothetical protein ABZ470_31875 [Streptosporangium sp. NPDC020072]|uniref:hypothetical protein n=1 Tax=Streptosporangium sp. NPDC020072 TaxID=3154788 RepID=UPI00341B0416